MLLSFIFCIVNLVYHYYAFPKHKQVYAFLTSQGPLWVKMGQTMCHRRDLFPKHIISQLKKLTIETPPIPYTELNAYVPSQFNIRKTLLGSGCIAQTYLGNFKRKHVVVKITRPDVDKRARTDLKIFKAILYLASFFSYEIKNLYKTLRFECLEQTMLEQCDLRNEAANMRTFKRDYADIRFITVPGIHYVSKRVLVMEYMKGTDIESFVKKRPSQSNHLVDNYNLLYKNMLYSRGNFHADLHKGNFKISMNKTGPVLNIFDFGMMIRMSDKMITDLHDIFFMTVVLDLDGFVKVLERYNKSSVKLFRRDIHHYLAGYIKNVRQYKKVFYEFANGDASRETYDKLMRHRKEFYENKFDPNSVFELMHYHGLQLPSQLMFCIIDFDRLLRFSTTYQTNDHGQCFLRSFLTGTEMGIFSKSTHLKKSQVRNILCLKKYMDMGNTNVKWT